MRRVFIYFAIVTFAACAKKETVNCENQRYMPATIGYTKDELDTIVLRWYQRGSNFTQPLDTFLVDNRPLGGRGDTVFLPNVDGGDPPPPGARPYTYHADLEVYIPSVQRNYRISNIEHSGYLTENVRKGGGCTNFLIGYTLDGVRTTWVEEPTYIFMKR